MSIIEDYARSIMLTKENILNLVDEYTLYAHYLEYAPELATRYRSPIRPDDERPSFTIFESNNNYYEYLWKDHGSNESGSIFKLIKILHGLSNLHEVLTLIDKDFELGLGSGGVRNNKITRYDKPENREEIVIRVKLRKWNDTDKLYWEEQGLSIPFISKAQVFPIECFWTKRSQTIPIIPKGICYAYAIGPYFKIYQPFNPEFKFITNYPSHYIEGFIQLKKVNTDLLIITKSFKETMWFQENMGIDAVAGKSESTMIPVEYINYFRKIYKRIIVFLDNDAAGYKASYKYQELYQLDWCAIYPCLLTNAKDPTDHNKLYGKENTIQLISQIIE